MVFGDEFSEELCDKFVIKFGESQKCSPNLSTKTKGSFLLILTILQYSEVCASYYIVYTTHHEILLITLQKTICPLI